MRTLRIRVLQKSSLVSSVMAPLAPAGCLSRVNSRDSKILRGATTKTTESSDLPYRLVGIGQNVGRRRCMSVDEARQVLSEDIRWYCGFGRISGDRKPRRALARRLKGICSNTQVMPLSNVVELLETAMAAGDMSQAPGLIRAGVSRAVPSRQGPLPRVPFPS